MRQAMARGAWREAAVEADAWLAAGGCDWAIRLNGAVSRGRADPGGAEAALAQAELALAESGGHRQARLGLAELAVQAGQWERALEVLDGLTEAGCGPALQLRVRALARLRLDQEAMASLQRVPPPGRDVAWAISLAEVHIQACRWSEAERLLRAVLEHHPLLPLAHHNLALVLLSQRRCVEAWPHYEWRPGNPRLAADGRPQPLPPLEQLAGRRLRVIGEQGIGDQLMMARYLPALASAASTVDLWPAERLVPLLSRWLGEQEGRLRIHRSATSLPPLAADELVLGSGSLPLLLWSALGTAAGAARLQADPGRIAPWQRRLAALGPGRRLGLGWLGGSSGSDRRERGLSPATCHRLMANADVHWIDLQYLGPASGAAAALVLPAIAPVAPPAVLHRFGAVGHDIEDTLALMACLDGVVTSRQTVAHLAGALGLPGRVLVPARPEWRYWGEGGRWAWYPSLELGGLEPPGDDLLPLELA